MAVDTDETITPEQEAALFDAAISEGFNGDAPTETPVKPETPARSPEETPPVEEPPKEAATAEPVTPEYVQLTKAQYDELLKLKEGQSKLDQVHGTVGHVQQMLKALQEGGAPISATSEDFAELAEDFPEFRDALVKGQNRLLSRLKIPVPSTQAVNPAEVVEKALRSMAEETLDEEHPDWREVTGPNTAFRQWVSTQPQAYQDKLWSSNNGSFVSRQIAKFKAEQEKAKAPAPDKPKNDRQERLRAAAVPKGVAPSSTPTSDESGFSSGFQSEAKTLGLAV